MRNFTLLVVLLCAVCSCSEQAPSDRWFKWPPTDCVSDSLVRLLEYSYAESWPDSVRLGLLHELDIAARQSVHPQAAARLLYWKAHTAWLHSGDSVKEMLAQAVSLTDSSRFAYDVRRMRTLQMSLPDRNIFESYRRAVDDVAYYASEADSVMLASSYQHIGVDLNFIGDYDNGVEYLHKSNRLYVALGMDKVYRKNLLNFAIALRHSSPGVADSIMSLLREWPDDNENVKFRTLVLLQSYDDTGRYQHLTDAAGLLARYRDVDELKLRVESKICMHLYSEGATDSLRVHLDSALSLLRCLPNHSAGIPVLSIAALAEAGRQNYERAFIYSWRCSGMMDSIYTHDRPVEVMRMEGRVAIEDLRRREKQHRRENLLNVAIALLSGCVVVMVIVLWFVGRLRRQAVMRVRAEAEVANKRRQLMVSRMVMEEKDKLIDWIEKSVGDLEQERKLDAAGALEFRRKIKNYMALRGDWNRFRDEADIADPTFSRSLKEAFPGITDAQLRLAEYIVAGLNSKHIAQKMGISPDSVKKSRYRLRQKMNLPSGISLEEELRKYKKFS